MISTKNPFPGMNPFLEENWAPVHTKLISYVDDEIIFMAKTKALSKSEKSEKRILITGGTGFLGTHIVRQFLDAGETNLKVMASRVPEWMKDAGVKAIEGDRQAR